MRKGAYRFAISGLLVLLTALVSQLPVVDGAARQVPAESILRLHIIAHSDSAGDQALKNRVREWLLPLLAHELPPEATLTEVRAYFLANRDRLERGAEAVLRRHGQEAPVRIVLGQAWFPEKTYGSLTLPAGYYEAVRVVIGAGQGGNWWCVLFPPLCFNVEQVTASDLETLNALFPLVDEAVLWPPRYEVRLKIVEWLTSLQTDYRSLLGWLK
mgnify:CR=1 FL=1